MIAKLTKFLLFVTTFRQIYADVHSHSHGGSHVDVEVKKVDFEDTQNLTLCCPLGIKVPISKKNMF